MRCAKLKKRKESKRLTKEQKKEISEIKYLIELFGDDSDTTIKKYFGRVRTSHLQLTKRKLIVSEIIHWYTFVDEYLSMLICFYFFGTRKSFIHLWKTKKFQNFNYYILEKLGFLQKLEFVQAVHEMPSSVHKTILALNGIRNGVAHAFFPENLKKSKPIFESLDVLELDGIKKLNEKMSEVFSFFGEKVHKHLEAVV